MPKDEIIKSFPLKLESTQMLISISIKYCIGSFGWRQKVKRLDKKKTALTVDAMVVYIDNPVNLHIVY